MLTFLAANMGLKKPPLYSAMNTTHKPRHEADSPVMHIGLGWHILTINNRRIVWHNGGTGGYWCFAGFVGEQQKGIVVLTNTNQTIDDIGFHLLDPNIPLNPLDPNLPLHRTKFPDEPVNVDLAPGEKLPTGDQIMQRFIECLGGRDVLAGTKNRLLKATMEMKQLGLKGTTTTYQARTNKYYAKMDFAGLMTMEQGTDGQIVWELSSMTGAKILQGAEQATMLLHYRFDDINYGQLYKKIECVGIEKIGDQTCYKVVFTPKQAAAFTAYFSKTSGLMTKTIVTIPAQSGQIKVEMFTSDYRKVDGILYPHQVIERAMNIDTYYTVESLKHNVEMPENQFEPPTTIKKLLE